VKIAWREPLAGQVILSPFLAGGSRFTNREIEEYLRLIISSRGRLGFFDWNLFFIFLFLFFFDIFSKHGVDVMSTRCKINIIHQEQGGTSAPRIISVD
jgi:hypothetical protein